MVDASSSTWSVGRLKTVFAYRDDGPMASLTRWKPRKIACTEHRDHGDRPGQMHVVKFRQGKPAGAAALISELLCTQLLAAGGARTLEPRIVQVSPAFSASCETKSEISYSIEPGPHYGTILRWDVENGPPLRIDLLAEPQELLDIWAFDSWFYNLDRKTYGNTLLALAPGGKFHLIAADQSDCFGGSGRFADGTWRKVLNVERPAETLDCLDAAILECGVQGLHLAIEKTRTAFRSVDAAMDAVPQLWWQLAKIDRRAVRAALDQRVRRMETILNVKHWEGLGDVKGQGHLF